MLSANIITYISKFVIGRSRPHVYLSQENMSLFRLILIILTIMHQCLLDTHKHHLLLQSYYVHFSQKYKYLFIAIAILSSLSRVVLSFYWLSDIVIGAVFGITIPIL